jgi:hypothetical protein
MLHHEGVTGLTWLIIAPWSDLIWGPFQRQEVQIDVAGEARRPNTVPLWEAKARNLQLETTSMSSPQL